MLEQIETDKIFSLDIDFKDPLQKKLFSIMKGPIEHVLAFPRLNRAYADISQMTDSRPFTDKVLERLDLTYELSEQDLSRLMITKGPVIVVANHPFGGIEGIILASILRSLRCDVKFMANYLLNAIPEMREMLIAVDPFKRGSSVRENIRPIRECIHWVRNGGMLVVFPAGEVSHFDIQKGTVTDPAWSPSIARIIKKTNAPVLPVFFQGTNSTAFHMAGLVHPFLRTALLPNELLNKGRKIIQVRSGDVISFDRLKSLEQDAVIMEYLRLRTYILEHRQTNQRSRRFLSFPSIRIHNTGGSIINPQKPDDLAKEIRLLPPSQTLVESGDHVVLHATADQIPHVLLEIGRLREITFRAVGEGTGKAFDLDRFDRSYVHMFVWSKTKKEVIGAYRLGRTDELTKQHGLHGIYTSTLFRYRKDFLDRLGPALELGRSFIRPEYQKSYAPLLLLWKGIGKFIIENPYYKTLFGPVSITDEYQPMSKQLMVGFLKKTKFRQDMAEFVRARKPLRSRSVRGWDMDAAVRFLNDDIDDISELISSIETDNKGVPILLKQYIRLGGKIIGFNVDPAFGNVLDGLIMVDLTKTEPKMLERYLGKDGAQRFLSYHQHTETDRHASCA
ncbi:MAG TPA: GNAT family N-acyltransferase [Nitrospirota bacterium]|nr:GNAT family N-acyltransferase [Nitrospirota bacterium]